MSKTESFLFVVGATHHTAPLEWREKLALNPTALPKLEQKLGDLTGLQEYAILNTCNRVEFYGVAETDATLDQLRAVFCEHQEIEVDAFVAKQLCKIDSDAIHHLGAVSAGLESQLVGENEIFGQVKDAYAAAQKTQRVGPTLHKVFQKTFQAAKQVRTHTGISEGQVSVANVSVDLATTIFGDLSDARILLAGAGEIGEQAAKAFRSRGATDLTVSSRTADNAMQLAQALDGRALPFETLADHLSQFDVIVCATAAPGSILSSPAVAKAMRQRPAAPLFLIDLALPRDIDAAVAKIDNVYLYNLDDLAAISEENKSARMAEITKARDMIAAKAHHLWENLQRRREASN
ncbi:MAG: glutamyl-tRNA reductase [Opitutaceae bacterium]|nr:glutamyl-tRNA reductase [Opitutaceae bacterium]